MCRAAYQKPRWVEEIGTVSNILSVIFAAFIGAATWALSSEVKSIQENAAKEAALARDNDALLRFGENLMRSWEQMSVSRSCINTLNAYISDSSFVPIKREDFGSTWVFKQFKDQAPTDIAEIARQSCPSKDPNTLMGAIYYSLISYESALINWHPNLSHERKSLYYKHLTPGLCFENSSISKLLNFDREKLDQSISASFPGVSNFHRECRLALTYTDTRLALEQKRN